MDGEQAKFLRAQMPLTDTLGIEFVEAGATEVRATLAWRQELCTAGGLMHGGALMALADSAGGVCAFLNLPEGSAGTATIESKTNLMRGVREGSVTAIARPLHSGKRNVVIETELRDGEDRLVAKTTQTQAVL